MCGGGGKSCTFLGRPADEGRTLRPAGAHRPPECPVTPVRTDAGWDAPFPERESGCAESPGSDADRAAALPPARPRWPTSTRAEPPRLACQHTTAAPACQPTVDLHTDTRSSYLPARPGPCTPTNRRPYQPAHPRPCTPTNRRPCAAAPRRHRPDAPFRGPAAARRALRHGAPSGAPPQGRCAAPPLRPNDLSGSHPLSPGLGLSDLARVSFLSPGSLSGPHLQVSLPDLRPGPAGLRRHSRRGSGGHAPHAPLFAGPSPRRRHPPGHGPGNSTS